MRGVAVPCEVGESFKLQPGGAPLGNGGGATAIPGVVSSGGRPSGLPIGSELHTGRTGRVDIRSKSVRLLGLTKFSASLEVGSDGWCTAWVPELLGCFLNERSERTALRMLPEATGAYLRWLRRHGERIRLPSRIVVNVAERWQVPEPLRWGNYEVLHGFERPPVTRIEIGAALRWMGFMRRDTLKLFRQLPPEGLDWTRPGQERTIRKHLYHLAHGEQWYLQRLDLGPRPDSAAPTGDPIPYLASVRAMVISRLSRLTREERVRIVQADNGRWWSARKMLGRMLYHERYHIRSMARIARHHRVRVPDGLGGWSRYHK